MSFNVLWIAWCEVLLDLLLLELLCELRLAFTFFPGEMGIVFTFDLVSADNHNIV